MPRRTAQEIREILAKDKKLFRGQSVSWTTPLGGKRFGCVIDTPDHVIEKAHLLVISSNGQLELDAITLKAEPDVHNAIQRDLLETYGPFCDDCHLAPCGCAMIKFRQKLTVIEESLP